MHYFDIFSFCKFSYMNLDVLCCAFPSIIYRRVQATTIKQADLEEPGIEPPTSVVSGRLTLTPQPQPPFWTVSTVSTTTRHPNTSNSVHGVLLHSFKNTSMRHTFAVLSLPWSHTHCSIWLYPPTYIWCIVPEGHIHSMGGMLHGGLCLRTQYCQ